MPLDRSKSVSYRDRAAICAWCAEQASSPEAAASLLYLQQMWILVAEVAEIVEGTSERSQPSGEPDDVSLQ
jgi:hypothetical protein